MISFLDLEDPSYNAAVTLGSLKKSELRFGTGGASDVLVVSEAPLAITSIPAASVEISYPIRGDITQLPFVGISPITDSIAVVENLISGSIPQPATSLDTSKRKIFDTLFFSSLPKSDLVVITEQALIGTLGSGCMGFATDYVNTRGWNEEQTKDDVGTMYFNTANYSDNVPVLENSLPNPALASPVTVAKKVNSIFCDCLFFFTGTYDDKKIVTENVLSITLVGAPTIVKNKYFDGSMTFYTSNPTNIVGITAVVDPPALTSTFGDLTKCRNVSLSGSVVGTSDYILIVLNANNDRIIFTDILSPGAWTRKITTEDDTVTVVGVNKDTGKKSFAYKSINIAGVSS